MCATCETGRDRRFRADAAVRPKRLDSRAAHTAIGRSTLA
jgi:hypothetical protein